MQDQNHQQRISILKGMLKAFILLFVLVLAYLMFFGGDKSVKKTVSTISEISIDASRFENRPNYVYAGLVNARPLLILSYQPEDYECHNLSQAQWLVVWNQGTDLSCPLSLVNVANEEGQQCRMLKDQCRGSVYRLDGSVLPGQLATGNLRKPEYEVEKLAGQWKFKIQVD